MNNNQLDDVFRTNKGESIEQRTYRLLKIANKNDAGVAIDSDFAGKMFKSVCENSIFKLHCKMTELAIAEERDACAASCSSVRNSAVDCMQNCLATGAELCRRSINERSQ